MFSCNLPPALWQSDRDLLRATGVTRGCNGCRIESVQEVDHRSSWESNPRSLDHESVALPLSVIIWGILFCTLEKEVLVIG